MVTKITKKTYNGFVVFVSFVFFVAAAVGPLQQRPSARLSERRS